MYTFISTYLPFIYFITENPFNLAASSLLFLFCIWLGWNAQWRLILIYLLGAVVAYVLSILMYLSHGWILSIIGGLFNSIIAVTSLGVMLGKILSQRKERN